MQNSDNWPWDTTPLAQATSVHGFHIQLLPFTFKNIISICFADLSTYSLVQNKHCLFDYEINIQPTPPISSSGHTLSTGSLLNLEGFDKLQSHYKY